VQSLILMVALSAQLPSVALSPELARVLTDYEAAWQGKDAAALAALFAEDGFVLPNGAPAVRGRAAIERHYTGHGGPLALRALAFATEGAVGYIIGGYAAEKGQPDTGKFTLTLRRAEDGRWLIQSDMDNNNSRPRAPAASPAPAGGPAEVKVTHDHLVALCLDGAAVKEGERKWKLGPQEHALAFTMRNQPRSGMGGQAAGVAVVKFTPEAGHAYEVEVRAPGESFSTRVWERGQWSPVVRDRTVDRIVSSEPEWTDAACPPAVP
jgi:ketosteroid isomerase-like protein